MYQAQSVPKHLQVCLFYPSKQFNTLIVTCRAAVLMQKWEPHVHSLEKEIRAQMRGVKISVIVFSSGGVSSAQSRPLDPKRMTTLLDNGERK